MLQMILLLSSGLSAPKVAVVPVPASRRPPLPLSYVQMHCLVQSDMNLC